MKQDNSQKVNYLPIFMCLGLSIGTAIGTATDKLSVYMPIGISIGVCIGAILDAKNRKSSEDTSAADKENAE